MSVILRGKKTLLQRALAILRRPGITAHAYIAGASGVTVSGLPTNNFLLSDGSTGYSSTDSVVGLVKDAMNPTGGISASQATTANKPILRRGLVNMLTYSNDLTNADWVKSGTSTSGSPQKLIESAFGVTHSVRASGTTVIATTYTLAFKLKAAERSYVLIGQDASGTGYFEFDLAAGAYTAVTSGTYLSRSFATDSDGYRIVTITFSAANIGSAGCVFLENGSNSFSYTGDGASGIFFAGAALIQGTYTAQQILAQGGIPVTTTAAASNPLAGSYSWSFDGSNDSLALGSVPFQMADDFAVVCAARHGAPVSWATMFSVTGSTTTPRIQFYVDQIIGFVSAYFRDDAGASMMLAGSVDFRNSAPAVFTLCKRGTSVYLRANGAQVATTDNLSLGATTLTMAAIGTHASQAGDYMNGSIYSIEAVKGTFSDADLLVTERLAGQIAGITI